MDKNKAKQHASAEETVAAWNLLHPVGEGVVVTGDMGEKWRTTTRSEAWVLDSGYTPVVQLAGRAGCYALERVKPAGREADVLVSVTKEIDMKRSEIGDEKAAKAIAERAANLLERRILSRLLWGDVETPATPNPLLMMDAGVAATATDGLSTAPSLTMAELTRTMKELEALRTVYYRVSDAIDEEYEGKRVFAFMYEWEGDRVYLVHPDNLSRFIGEVEGFGLKTVEYGEVESGPHFSVI